VPLKRRGRRRRGSIANRLWLGLVVFLLVLWAQPETRALALVSTVVAAWWFYWFRGRR
jgi:hypothetical protein